MPSEAAKPEEKAGWTTSAWNWADWTLNTCGWAAGAAWNASSNAASSAKTALTKLKDDDLLDTAKKPEVKAFASDAGDLVKAASEANLTGVVKSSANITLKYLSPGLADNRMVDGSFKGATLGGLVCGPQCALIGGLAGGMYGVFKKAEKESDLEAGDEKQNTTEDDTVPKL